jgi:hypothetical protein
MTSRARRCAAAVNIRTLNLAGPGGDVPTPTDAVAEAMTRRLAR